MPDATHESGRLPPSPALLTPEQLAALEAGLHSLQTAVEARGFYGDSHPLARGAEEEALDRLRDATVGRAELVVARLGERVVAGGTRLPSERTLRGGLFATLEAAGFETLLLRRGLDADAVSAFVAGVHGRRLDSLPPAASVAPGHLQAGAADGAEVALGASPSADAATLTRPVGEAFKKILRGGPIAGEALDDLVERLGQAARVGSGALLPMQSLKNHDDYTFTHAVNVGILSSGLARAANLPERVIRDVTLAGMLHDAGKEEVPRGLLNKPGRLTGEEFDVIQSHPAAGARLLFKATGVPALAAVAAFEHHMNADGSGYPRVAGGHRRHPASQMVQLADVFDALRTRRSYRDALPLAEVHGILLEGRGVHYDPALLDLFLAEVVHDAFEAADATEPATPAQPLPAAA